MAPLHYDQHHLDSEIGKTLFDYADSLKVRVPTSCGRTGECHECIVDIRRGMDALSPLADSETFLRESYRLACQVSIVDPDADVEFSVLRRQPRILTDSIRRQFDIGPVTHRQGEHVYHGDDQLDTYSGQMYGLAVDLGTTTTANHHGAPAITSAAGLKPAEEHTYLRARLTTMELPQSLLQAGLQARRRKYHVSCFFVFL